ncbi:hypothetical protein QBC35DRAFT_452733 [Podospora australis]|uniref:Uncharacterized protein n=1 Tax=Podospora australis TaxID=1536484 RepID=A0AAN7AIL2_9PEZI|nr:hypothetical protein QBC35DRAFT_452733 [Podospora australis]
MAKLLLGLTLLAPYALAVHLPAPTDVSPNAVNARQISQIREGLKKGRIIPDSKSTSFSQLPEYLYLQLNFFDIDLQWWSGEDATTFAVAVDMGAKLPPCATVGSPNLVLIDLTNGKESTTNMTYVLAITMSDFSPDFGRTTEQYYEEIAEYWDEPAIALDGLSRLRFGFWWIRSGIFVMFRAANGTRERLSTDPYHAPRKWHPWDLRKHAKENGLDPIAATYFLVDWQDPETRCPTDEARWQTEFNPRNPTPVSSSLNP